MIHIDISNFRAINHASLDVDGITVLAGENGSGKSTISKIVYHTFYTACHFEEIENTNSVAEMFPLYWQFRDAVRDFVSGLKGVFPEVKKIDLSTRGMGNISEYLLLVEAELSKYFCDPLYQDERLTHSRNRFSKSICSLVGATEKEDISNPLELVKRKYNDIENKYENIKRDRPLKRFYYRIKSVFEEEVDTKTICVKELGENLLNREMERLNSTIDTREVFYCDTPWMVDRKQGSRFPNFLYDDDEDIRLFHRNALRGVLSTCTKSTSEPHPIQIDEIIGGQTLAKEDEGAYTFEFKRGNGQILDLFHCATGLKAFSILQMLYLGGKLRKGVLLILDEPEANLHPQWVVEYARLIVLLWRQHGVRFLISSHSPDMVAAIQAIAQKEGVRESTKFYVAERSKSNPLRYDYKDLGFEVGEIFASFNKSMVGIVKYGADVE